MQGTHEQEKEYHLLDIPLISRYHICLNIKKFTKKNYTYLYKIFRLLCHRNCKIPLATFIFVHQIYITGSE